jgi:hypothetical protein
MANHGRKKRLKSQELADRHQQKEARTLDALIEFDQFNKSILPQLKKMILEGWSPEKIRKHFAPIVQAQVVDKAMRGDFRAQKDILDRHEGMAVQRVEQKTTYQKMPQRELAALALQKLRDAGVIDADFKPVEVSSEDAE